MGWGRGVLGVLGLVVVRVDGRWKIRQIDLERSGLAGGELRKNLGGCSTDFDVTNYRKVNTCSVQWQCGESKSHHNFK